MINKINKILAFIVLASFAFGATDSPVASLTFYLGKVAYKNKIMKEWQPVNKGMAFFEGDQLKTLDDGKAELFFYTGTKVRIANATEIEFTKDEKKKNKSIFLNMGQLWSQVRKGDNFDIESVHGVASVKGTELDIENTGEQMNVWVAEGLVLIQNANGQVLAEKNTKTSIKGNEKPDKKNIGKDELPKWKDDFAAEAILIINAPGTKMENKAFKVYLTLKDPKKDKLFNGEVLVSLKSLTPEAGVAMIENTSDFVKNLDLKIIDGKSDFWVKGAAGKAEINISGKNFTGITIPLDIQGTIMKREVQLKFIGKDLKEHTINLKYKLK